LDGIPARPTIYKGTQMRSRLEADYAGFLDRVGADWSYEPTCFAGPSGQWLPDFLERGQFDVFTELKPFGPFIDLMDETPSREVAAAVDRQLVQDERRVGDGSADRGSARVLGVWRQGADANDYAPRSRSPLVGLHGGHSVPVHLAWDGSGQSAAARIGARW
jgi:hypothetical protein